MQLLPGGLGARSILVMLSAVVLVHIGSVVLYAICTASTPASGWARDVAERIVAARRLLEQRPVGERDAVTLTLLTGSLQLHWTPDPPSMGCVTTGGETLDLSAAL